LKKNLRNATLEGVDRLISLRRNFLRQDLVIGFRETRLFGSRFSTNGFRVFVERD